VSPTVSTGAVDRRAADRRTVPVSDILAGLSHALDITEGHPRGHTARSCLIGMRIARLAGVPEKDKGDLFYGLLMKDAGCSSNAARVHQLFGGNEVEAKRAIWLRDWRRLHHRLAYALRTTGRGEGFVGRLQRLAGLAAAGPSASRELFTIRCDRGAAIALQLGLSAATASAIRSMDEHWDGGGHPEGLRGAAIPLLARIIGLAQVLEIFASEWGHTAACEVARQRSGRWFDPELVAALEPLERDEEFWLRLISHDERDLVAAAEPVHASVEATDDQLDRIAEAFAAVIDAKSPFTFDHSRRVAGLAEAIARRLGAPAADLVRIRRAGLLHDIGKLGVPNSILDKPGKLTPAEWEVVRRHPRYTFEVLDRVPVFRSFAFDASCHHEMLDGSGYHLGLTGPQLTRDARILALADRADALLADRPYRRGLAPSAVWAILERDCVEGRLCADATAAVRDLLEASAPNSTTSAPPLALCG
jgi:putative nucleotidyltransferase with HDIG domain